MELVVRATIVYWFLWLVVRGTGKRSLAELTPLDLLVIVVLGDFVRGLLRVWVRGVAGEPYNLGNDEEVSIAHAAAVVATLAGPPPLAIHHERSEDPDYVTDNPQRRCPDLTKVRRLGWTPAVPLADGFARTLASYREEAAS